VPAVSGQREFTGPGDATCQQCGMKLYLTENGLLGCYPSENWTEEGYGMRLKKNE
jgi:hypothetical protein